MTILNATPWDFANVPKNTAYLSRHNFDRIPAFAAENPNAEWVMIDMELDMANPGRIEDVLAQLDTHMPKAKRIGYRSDLRCSTPQQQAEAIMRAQGANDVSWEGVNVFLHAWGCDVYLMGIPKSDPATGAVMCDHNATKAQVRPYYALNAEPMQVLASVTGKPAIPCIHERYHEGHGLPPWYWLRIDVWQHCIASAVVQWPDSDLAWWSGSIQEPGETRYYDVQPKDLQPFADVIASIPNPP